MFEQAIAQPLFPTHLWIHKLKSETSERMNQSILQTLGRILPAAESGSGTRTRQSSQDLHLIPEFAELVEVIRFATRGVLDAMQTKYEDFEITGCWANIGAPGSQHSLHSHANNFLSGVYYVKTSPGSDTISFRDPRDQRSIIQPKYQETNQFNIAVQNVAAEPGSLIIFPSWLKHSVPLNRSNEERVSISFNAMFSNFAATISPPRWSGIPIKKDRA